MKVLLRQRERGDFLARCDGRQVFLLQRVRAECRNRAGAEALHGEREIGEAGMARQRFANDRERTDIERFERAAEFPRHAIFQPAVASERLDERAAGRIDIVMRAGGVDDGGQGR